MCGCCAGDSKDAEDGENRSLRNPMDTKHRGCTDIIPLIIFILFWVGMIYIAAFSIVWGDVWRLLYGYDSFGNTCGKENEMNKVSNFSGMDLTDRKFVFFMDIKYAKESMEVCVKQCPEEQLNNTQDLLDFYNKTGSQLTRYDIDPSICVNESLQNREGPCPIYPVYASTDFISRCIPAYLPALAQHIQENIIGFFNESDIFQRVISDLYTSWKLMLLLAAIAFVFALVMVILIRFLAAIIVWLIMIVAALGSIAGTAFLWWTYIQKRGEMEEKEGQQIPLLKIEIDSEMAFLVYSIIATILTVILLLIMIVMRKRVALVVALFQEAGKVVIAMPCILAQPIWTFFSLILFFAYWFVVLAFLSTAGEPSPDPKNPLFVRFEDKQPVRYMWWYHIVGLIWTAEFIIACQQLVIAGAVAKWYFTRNKKEVSCAVGGSISILIMNHLGTAAFGAFIITLVKLPRYILMYLQQKLKGKTNKCAECCMKCCICCLWCLEKCLKYLNQNAYTVTAIRGTNFCTSARKAFNTLISNVLRVAAINSVGDFVLFLGKIGVMAATGAVGIIMFRGDPDLHYYFIPVLLVFVFSYFVAHAFLSMYEMVIDALLLCFCEDCQINDGVTPGREYYMHPSLMEFVKNSSEALDNLKKSKDATDADENAAETQPMTAMDKPEPTEDDSKL